MCRFTMYLGPPIRLDSLLIEPTHSLILQSAHATERAEPLNGDGFGVGWYAPELSECPGVFRSVAPAWNNPNLRSLAGVVSSPCVMAHVRAASAGMPVAEANCHPFQHGPYLFMHNGHLGSFRSVRRTLLAGLCEEAFELVTGGTDSEHLFAIFIDELIGANTEDPLAMAACLNRAVWRALALVKDLGGQHPSFLNLAVSDGHRVAACRFTDDPTHAPESLYLVQRGLYDPVAKGSPARRQHEDSTSFVVSSERLTDDPLWRSIEPNHLVSLARDGTSSVFRMEPDGLVPAHGLTQPAGAAVQRLAILLRGPLALEPELACDRLEDRCKGLCSHVHLNTQSGHEQYPFRNKIPQLSRIPQLRLSPHALPRKGDPDATTVLADAEAN